MPPGQTKISAYRAMATTAKEQLSTPQYLCALWARNNLSYDLIDDPMFRHQFGVCIPIGFNRMKLSEEMHSLHSDVRSHLSDKSINSPMTVRMNIVPLYDVPPKRQRVQ